MTIEGWNFAMILILTLFMESSVASMSVLVDATVVAGSVKDGTYGRARLWASVGWGVFALFAGYILTKFGIHTCFMIFAAIYASASIPTFLIPAGLLASKNQHLRKTSNGESISNDSSTTANPSTTPAMNENTTPASIVVGDDTTTNTNNVVQLSTSFTVAGSAVSRRTSRRSSHHSTSHVITVEVDAGSRRTSSTQQQQTVVVGGTPPEPIESLKIHTLDDIEAAKGNIKIKELKKSASSAPVCAEVAVVQQESIWKGLRTLFSDVYVLTFMFIAFLMGIGNGFIGYLFLLLTDLGASGTLLGLCLAMNCVGEVPFFYYSGALIKKLGVTMALNLAMAAYIVRLGAYALLPWYPSLWIVLPIELLQGLTFGLAYSAGTVHCCRIAPRYLRSTIQSIFSGLYTGIGAGIGGFAGGMIYNAFNGQTMYWIATVVLLGGFAISNFTNLIYYLRKGAKRGFKRAKQAGHRVKNSFYRMKASGSGTSSEFGSGSGNGSRAPSELGGEENPRTPTAAATGGGVPMIPVLYEKSNASPIV